MADQFRITLAQLNPSVGDIDGNAERARNAWREAKQADSDFLALSEAFITGYQTQDLVMRPGFYQEAMAAISALAQDCADGPAIGIGGPYHDGHDLYNAYYVLKDGNVIGRSLKQILPNFNVFDERRHFAAAPPQGPISLGPIRIGVPICEDAWHAESVCETLAESGADILLAVNGSPYYRNKSDIRLNQMVARVVETDLPLIYLNMVGGQDDQVFDGYSFALNRGGNLAFRLQGFQEEIRHITLQKTDDGWEVAASDIAKIEDEWTQDYLAMVLGLRDYLRKTGFKKLLLGLSGGIDSAIVATIAADAIGPENLHAVMLPSEFTSQASLDDAKLLAAQLGCKYDIIPIAQGRDAITQTLEPFFQGLDADITEENIQSRLRGLLLMALSNKSGAMLLTTGNKSEVAVGYATIYGDMSGGFNPIKDLYKTRVFEQCNWRNSNHFAWMLGPKGAVIPQNIITKPPSAELREDQKDDDSLPPYDILDAILEGLIDEEKSVAELVAQGFSRETVKHVEHLIYISEYKRFQSAPGTRLTARAFWLDRRYPIANRWRDKT